MFSQAKNAKESRENATRKAVAEAVAGAAEAVEAQAVAEAEAQAVAEAEAQAVAEAEAQAVAVLYGSSDEETEVTKKEASEDDEASENEASDDDFELRQEEMKSEIQAYIGVDNNEAAVMGLYAPAAVEAVVQLHGPIICGHSYICPVCLTPTKKRKEFRSLFSYRKHNKDVHEIETDEDGNTSEPLPTEVDAVVNMMQDMNLSQLEQIMTFITSKI
jgi:hypothetical protein